MHNSEKLKARSRSVYKADPSKKAAAAALYKLQPDKKMESRTVYRSKPEVMKETFRKYHATHRGVRLQYFQKYHCYTKRVKVTKARYSLIQPTQLLIEKCFRLMQANPLTDKETKGNLMEQYNSQLWCGNETKYKRFGSPVVRLPTKRLIGRSLQLRRKYAGFLLNSIRRIKSITLKTQDDLGKGCHTKSTEPYFYEAAYLHVRETVIPVNDDVLLLKVLISG